MKTKKILILDDYDTLGEIYEEHLNSSGFLAKWVPNLRTARRAAKSFKADLLLVDHGLGGDEKNGIDAIPELKKLYPKAIIIIFSNYSGYFLKDKALALGAKDFWLKIDTNLAQLTQALQKIFDQ